jgi:CHAT domain-containing protein
VDDPDDLAYLGSLTTPPALLHLSAHNVLINNAPIFCALHLTRNFLSVEQCYAMRLAGTRLVTLSGCSTAAGMETGGALLAFQSAFFVAGARHVMSSLWSIDARPTVTWMTLFYRLLNDGLSIPAALRQTQRMLLHDAETGHPAIWAAFIVSRR